jgi:hypothetical protein
MTIGIDAPEDSLAGDLLRGAPAIGQFINEPVSRVYYLAERQLLPIGRLGSALIASKRRLREHYEQITHGEEAAERTASAWPQHRESGRPARAHPRRQAIA